MAKKRLDEETNKKLCAKIKAERIKHLLCQAEFAELTHISRNTIGKIERYETIPAEDTLKKIADALKIKYSELTNVDNVDLDEYEKLFNSFG